MEDRVVTQPQSWQQVNQQTLSTAIAQVRSLLQYYGQSAEQSQAGTSLQTQTPPAFIDVADIAANGSGSSALQQLSQVFGLSPFERHILLLCAGMEVMGDWDVLCAQANGNLQRNYPTLSLALTIFPEAHWHALSPDAMLRKWRLIEIGDGNSLAHAPLRLDERVLHYLMGVQYLDERLWSVLEPVNREATGMLVPSHEAIATRILQVWQQAMGQLPVIQLCGTNEQTKRAIALRVCQQIQATLFALPTEALPTQNESLSLIQCLLEREWRLSRAAVLLDFDYVDKLPFGVTRLIETLQVPLIISTAIRYSQRHRSIVTFEVDAPTALEQHQLWSTALQPIHPMPDAQVYHLVSHFNLTPGQIQSATLTLKASETHDPQTLWEICRTQSRPRLDELAQRIEETVRFSDLVLPEREQQVLQAIAAQVRQRMRVYQDWGFGSSKKRGLGISALFAGASGTGKTMAAEAIATELQLDLYRIDLSSIVSKYIGETEKNLRRLFDAAEGGGVILLFDEADALFGKRSEVKDSHDRHANVEVAYLLQRMESYQGLAILTTNLKSALDQAFLRRIRFVINFPFPKAPQRAEIWRRIFPSQTPTEGLDYKLLAKLEVAGGNIKSIAMNAAFIAAEENQPIQMKHLLQAGRSEYIKIEKVLTDAEIRSWGIE